MPVMGAHSGSQHLLVLEPTLRTFYESSVFVMVRKRVCNFHVSVKALQDHEKLGIDGGNFKSMNIPGVDALVRC